MAGTDPARNREDAALPQFTSDWFSQNVPAWRGFFGKLKWDSATAKTVVEIGSYEGRASL